MKRRTIMMIAHIPLFPARRGATAEQQQNDRRDWATFSRWGQRRKVTSSIRLSYLKTRFAMSMPNGLWYEKLDGRTRKLVSVPCSRPDPADFTPKVEVSSESSM